MRKIVFLFAASLAAQTANDFRFAIVGDRTGETVPGVYEQVWREIAAARPAFAINVGDTIQGLNDATAEAEWLRVRPVWTRFRIPFYFTPGNHDIWSPQSRKIYEQQTRRPAFYSFNFQNAHFTVLDNSGSLQLSQEQLQFLEKDLQSNRSRSPKFVFFHQPFWLLPVKLGNSNYPFHLLMKKYEVSYVISGHVHQASTAELDGVTYLVVGSSGGHLRGHDPAADTAQGWFYHHVKVHVQGTNAEVEVQEIGPTFGEGRAFHLPRTTLQWR